jgi:hypothetical protein
MSPFMSGICSHFYCHIQIIGYIVAITEPVAIELIIFE